MYLAGHVSGLIMGLTLLLGGWRGCKLHECRSAVPRQDSRVHARASMVMKCHRFGLMCSSGRKREL